MLSITLGPIALPVAPLLLLLAVWGASWLASWLAARREQGTNVAASAAGNTIVVAAMLGLLAARLAHLALNAQPYLASPGSAFDLRDGGWQAPAGAVAGAAWLAWRAWRTPPLRRPLAVSALAGTAFWVATTLATGVHNAPPMPALALTELDGAASVDLRRAAAGRPVVINLWASWCGPCRQEMPALAAAQQRQTRVGFLFVNQGETVAAVHSYLAGLGLPLREVLLDPGSKLGPAVGSRGLPTTLFYDAQGRLVDAHFGVLNDAALESRLRRLRGASVTEPAAGSPPWPAGPAAVR